MNLIQFIHQMGTTFSSPIFCENLILAALFMCFQQQNWSRLLNSNSGKIEGCWIQVKNGFKAADENFMEKMLDSGTSYRIFKMICEDSTSWKFFIGRN